MKNTLLACLIAIVYVCALPAYGQSEGITIPLNENKEVEYSEVIDMPNLSKTELYKRCKRWFAVAYKSAKDVIQSDSEDEVIGKGAFDYSFVLNNYGATYSCTYTIVVNLKENKYRYKISGAMVSNPAGTYPVGNLVTGYQDAKNKIGKKSCKVQLDSIDANFKALVDSLKKAMATEKDEW